MINLDRAIQIGHECAAINSAINELITGWRNKNMSADKYDVYETELFIALSARREALRTELVGMK